MSACLGKSKFNPQSNNIGNYDEREYFQEPVKELVPEANRLTKGFEMMKANVENVTLRRSGCIGLCDQEPMMTLKDKVGHEYQYVKLNTQKVHEIVQDHIVGGQPVIAHLMHT